MFRLSTRLASATFASMALVSSSILLCECKSAEGLEDPRDPTTAQAAASQFERDDYYPIDRVSARRIVPMPTPPTIIEVDEERLALWRREWKLRAKTDDRMLIEVDGCGTRTTYSCWEVADYSTNVNTTGRGKKRILVGTVCLAENGYMSGGGNR
jgi:hypothetical protein